jgi:hypothetical protein
LAGKRAQAGSPTLEWIDRNQATQNAAPGTGLELPHMATSPKVNSVTFKLALFVPSAAIVRVTVDVQVEEDFSPIVFPEPTNVPQVVDKFTGLSESPTTTAVMDRMPGNCRHKSCTQCL